MKLVSDLLLSKYNSANFNRMEIVSEFAKPIPTAMKNKPVQRMSSLAKSGAMSSQDPKTRKRAMKSYGTAKAASRYISGR